MLTGREQRGHLRYGDLMSLCEWREWWCGLRWCVDEELECVDGEWRYIWDYSHNGCCYIYVALNSSIRVTMWTLTPNHHPINSSYYKKSRLTIPFQSPQSWIFQFITKIRQLSTKVKINLYLSCLHFRYT